MNSEKLRAWWSHRQGLDGSMQDVSPAEVLQRTGWARSVGGVGPYLTLFSRARIQRQQADDAVAQLQIHELPAARGCTYVVPASDFALALKVGQEFNDDMKVARKIGVTEAEIEKLCDAVLNALAAGPLEPEELRGRTGKFVRNLGEEGKKKGVTTTLPIVISNLQAAGEIRRLPTNGRLDQQRYRYALWRPNPLADFHLSSEEAYAELARRYFSWIGPASPAEFQWFSGLGVKAAKAALDHLDLKPLEPGDERLMFARDLADLHGFEPGNRPHYVLVGSLDGITLLRRDLKGLLATEDLKAKIFTAKGPQEAGGLSDLPSHAILDRGRIVGLWEYDVETESIAWMSFVKSNADVEDAVKRTEIFIRMDLGDARSFSLDSPKSRSPRIEAIRKAAGSVKVPKSKR